MIGSGAAEHSMLGRPAKNVDFGTGPSESMRELNQQQQQQQGVGGGKGEVNGGAGSHGTGGVAASSMKKLKRPLWRTFSRLSPRDGKGFGLQARSNSAGSKGVGNGMTAGDPADAARSSSRPAKPGGNPGDPAASGAHLAGDLSDATAGMSCSSSSSFSPPSRSSSPYAQEETLRDGTTLPAKTVC